jgi:ubiquinone/menaquinone biosynthesis C-methylase UbiE
MPESRFNDDETAQVYESLLVPLIFNPWANLLLKKAALSRGQHILDLATGPGTLARLASAALGPSGQVSAADLSPKMLAQASAKPAVPNGAPITYTEAPAEHLPFPAAQFDAIFCQQGLQFFPDQLAALKEAKRVLKPGAQLLVALWSDTEAMTLFACIHLALDRTLSQPPTRAALGWLSIPRLSELLTQAGFSEPQVGEEILFVTLERGLPQVLECVAGTTSGAAVRNLNDAQRVHFESQVAELLAPWTQDGVIRVPTRALIGVAKA